MLDARKLAARLPAKDLERARAWYAEKLGLHPAEERPGGLRYVIGGCEFALFASAGASDGSFTQLGFEVADLQTTVAELRRRGVVFEDYGEGPPSTPDRSPGQAGSGQGLHTEDGIATIDGNYPSKGKGEFAAWFRDCEGNMLGIGQPF